MNIDLLGKGFSRIGYDKKVLGTPGIFFHLNPETGGNLRREAAFDGIGSQFVDNQTDRQSGIGRETKVINAIVKIHLISAYGENLVEQVTDVIVHVDAGEDRRITESFMNYKDCVDLMFQIGQVGTRAEGCILYSKKGRNHHEVVFNPVVEFLHMKIFLLSSKNPAFAHFLHRYIPEGYQAADDLVLFILKRLDPGEKDLLRCIGMKFPFTDMVLR